MAYKNFKLFLNLFILISMIQSSFQLKNEEDNLELVQQFIDQLMEDSTAKTPIWNLRKSGWDYVDGVVMLGFLSLYSTTKDPKYLNFSEYFEDYRVSDDGTILGYKREDYNLDNINSAKALIAIYELTKIKKYRKAAARVYQQLLEHPRTKEGNFWHKKIYTNQVWLDGIYMALPFYMEYEVLYLNSKNINDIYNQFFNVYKIMRDDKTGLYYHGYDSSKEQFWADKETGLSPNFWLRSIGWLSMAIIDTLEKANSDKNSENWNNLKKMFVELCESMLKFQDETGMWWQVPNFPNKGKNYLETSGSAMFSYSYLKGVRLGYLEDEKFKEAGKKAFNGICDKYLIIENGKISLGGTCSVAGLGGSQKRDGSFEYYLSEAIAINDAKGIGPLILAYNEYKLLK